MSLEQATYDKIKNHFVATQTWEGFHRGCTVPLLCRQRRLRGLFLLGLGWFWRWMSGRGRALSLALIGFAEEVHRFLSSQMRWAYDVGPIDAFGPHRLRGIGISPRKRVPQSTDDSASEREGAFAEDVGNRKSPRPYLDARLV